MRRLGFRTGGQVLFSEELDRVLSLGVELGRVEVGVDVLRDARIGVGGLHHVLAPAAPVGIEIEDDRSRLLAVLLERLLERHPFDQAALGIRRLRRGAKGEADEQEEKQEAVDHAPKLSIAQNCLTLTRPS